MSRRSKRRAQHPTDATHTTPAAEATGATAGAPAPRARQTPLDVLLWALAAASIVVFFLGFYYAALGPALLAGVSIWQARENSPLRATRVARAVLTGMLAVMMGIGWYLIATGSTAPVPEEFQQAPTTAPTSTAAPA
ncbi:hypothetical protein C1Y63_06670 [Corynebacterium sp. 13CS0277]|uniref:hypothetical protein n=1 Tax=Corynebacterium sp. 13CS0277 TaxID=2071994 RepID=UPI000D02B332|nr:hypothetical protein [Corynebacterium sp. 13CS0277]PRQ11382.1 hypothetical protein C1Y63_06670 [Corynebacterium sp. 13CS0277]